MISASTPVSPHLASRCLLRCLSAIGASLWEPSRRAVEVSGWLSQQDVPLRHPGQLHHRTRASCRSKLTPSDHHQRPEAALHGASTFPISRSSVTDPSRFIALRRARCRKLAQRNGAPNSSRSPSPGPPSPSSRRLRQHHRAPKVPSSACPRGRLRCLTVKKAKVRRFSFTQDITSSSYEPDSLRRPETKPWLHSGPCRRGLLGVIHVRG
jgi:hypothetical protein